jgi:hypothetical protein
MCTVADDHPAGHSHRALILFTLYTDFRLRANCPGRSRGECPRFPGHSLPQPAASTGSGYLPFLGVRFLQDLKQCRDTRFQLDNKKNRQFLPELAVKMGGCIGDHTDTPASSKQRDKGGYATILSAEAKAQLNRFSNRAKRSLRCHAPIQYSYHAPGGRQVSTAGKLQEMSILFEGDETPLEFFGWPPQTIVHVPTIPLQQHPPVNSFLGALKFFRDDLAELLLCHRVISFSMLSINNQSMSSTMILPGSALSTQDISLMSFFNYNRLYPVRHYKEMPIIRRSF